MTWQIAKINLYNQMLYSKFLKIGTPLLPKSPSLLHHLNYYCSKEPPNMPPPTQQQQEQATDSYKGTSYSNWVLTRSANFNHDISYLKRKYGKDRYNIHKLTNMEFMCRMVNRENQYSLNVNERIMLLAQMNHVCNVMAKDKAIYHEFHRLVQAIMEKIKDPQDYICVGTFVNCLTDLGLFREVIWVQVMDCLFARKYDQQYDELYGLYVGLLKYRQYVEDFNDYLTIQKNEIIFNVPIFYRNSLQTLRQYIKFNIYNLKECRLLCRALYHSKINQGYFWKSIYDWFNIFIKEQLSKKDVQDYFIVAESSVEKVLFDDGMIRPRSILEELSEVAFILAQHRLISKRFVSFIEDLIVFSIEQGSQTYIKYLAIQKQQANQQEPNQQDKPKSPNEHIHTKSKQQEEAVQQMEKKYKTIFVNPTKISSQSIVHILMVIKKSYMEEGRQGSGYDHERTRTAIDNRAMNWLILKLCKRENRFNVGEILKIIDCRDFLEALKIDIKALVLEKIGDLRELTCSLNDVKDMLNFLPLAQFSNFSIVLESFLHKAHPAEILQLTKYIQSESITRSQLEAQSGNSHQPQQHTKPTHQTTSQPLKLKPNNQKWIPYLHKYFLMLPSIINLHEKYYSFDQNCYFLYLLLKNEQYWQNYVGYKYMGQIEQLKQSIKIASFSRGFKLQMNSYFYKLLNYVDLASFFDGG